MADVIARFKADTSGFTGGLKQVNRTFNELIDGISRTGRSIAQADKQEIEFVRSLGQMKTVSQSAKGKLSELTGAFTELKIKYNNLTDDAKKSDLGKALAGSLDQLKVRIAEGKKELESINKELGNGTTKSGSFAGGLNELGTRLGVNSEVMGFLTSGTMGFVAAAAGAATATYKLTAAFVEYNRELEKNQQIVSVTTGLSGAQADDMRHAMQALAKVYGVDFREAVNAANTLIQQFGVSSDEAISLMRDGMQGMIMGDGPKLLQMIQQYAPAFQQAGISASQLVAVIHNTEGGIFTDQNMNAIVMGIRNVRQMTKATHDALLAIGVDADKMLDDLNKGNISIFDALRQITYQMQDVGSSTQAAGEVMQTVFGRQGTAAGTNLNKAISELNLNLKETKKQTGKLGEEMDDLVDSADALSREMQKAFGVDSMETFWTKLKKKGTDALTAVLHAYNEYNEKVNTYSAKMESNWDAVSEAMYQQLPIYDKLIVKALQYFKIIKSSKSPGPEYEGWVGDPPTIFKPNEVNDVARTGGGHSSSRHSGGGHTGGHTGGRHGGRGGQNLSVTTQALNLKELAGVDSKIVELGEDFKHLTNAVVNGKSVIFESISGAFQMPSVDSIKREISAYQKMFNESTSQSEKLKLQAYIATDQSLLEALQAPEDWTIDENGVRIPVKLEMPKSLKDNKGLDFSKPADAAKETGKAWQAAAQAINSAGGAIQNMDSQGAKVAGIVAQAVANIALGFAQASASPATGASGVFGWIAAATAGLATMTATIASIKSQTKGFAEGGILGGQNYSGDVGTYAFRANASEMIINQSDQRALYDAIHSGNLGGGGNGSVMIRGEELYVPLRNYMRRTNKTL